MAKKKEPTWDEIGEAIGKKMEKGIKENEACCAWDKPWGKAKEHGGCFGRFLFALGVLLLFNFWGVFAGVPWWIRAMLVVGFSAMRF